MVLPFINKKRKTVIVVDDEDNIRHMISLLLKNMGANVKLAETGHEAINLARTIKPDLIITDLAMPEMTGFDVTTAIKNDPKTKSIPIVLLTGSGKPGDVDKAYALGITDYLLKPINTERFKIKIGKILNI